jgi:hypothetical protein
MTHTKIYDIRTPIWDGGDGRRSIGVATFRVPCLVDITYMDTAGKRLYPDTYTITKDFASNYPIKKFGGSPELYVIPIEELIIDETH